MWGNDRKSVDTPNPAIEALTELDPISDKAFERFRHFIYEKAGINLAPHKRQLVSSRLQKRLRHYGMRSYDTYIDLISQPGKEAERQHLVDLLTTNETYFYREPAHFDYLRAKILPQYRGRPLHVWSAACSTGEEVYTLAMVLAESIGRGDWNVLGSDINTQVVSTARLGIYPLEQAKGLPREWLSQYCLKGVRSQAGKLLINPKLKARTRFEERNLKKPREDGRQFEIVFLRNVLIYFDIPTKQLVLNCLSRSIAPGGYLFISHVESLHGITTDLTTIGPSIFRKPLR
ncbi:CheR family methyltransferase [Rhabdochromatium marinum]|uniref:CheR family methyltransferase n=1 Tax=Rhabdochromatium marinum TaxID=48729 RepID=UPI001904D55D|nr:CheR family methyltransferase [Rhabdochromatium marinum]MBK1647814.1 SAM-dependent methyltransferase [Rhabdochromatium marinum]